MASATYETAIRIAQKLTTEEQRQLHAELETLLEDQPVPRSTGRPFPHQVRPSLYDDLKKIEELAKEVGEGWQGDQDAVDTLTEMRRRG